MNSPLKMTILTLLIANLAWMATGEVALAEESAETAEALKIYRSAHFVLHTDLPQLAAQKKLKRLEATLHVAEKYWRRDMRGQIECYVIKDLKGCPDSALPHPLARVWLGGLEGATIADRVRGNRGGRTSSTVYASTRDGVAEHEVVHAYCCQTFGETGPDWYKEGMAQLLGSTIHDSQSECSPELFRQSVGRTRKSSREIVQSGRFTGELSNIFKSLLADRRDASQHVELSAFTPRHSEKVDQAKREYVSSWLLCHMLLHNPNYSDRFRLLGECYLTDKTSSFEQLFAAQQNEIAFEYAFYVKRIGVGYRVDLCHWDWGSAFHSLEERPGISREIQAARGYQASGLKVAAGRQYRYATVGSWSTSAQKRETSAQGDSQAGGRMVGVVMNGLQLTDRFELGDQGTFVSPGSGNLYLRCNDSWNQLADNRGSVRVRFHLPVKPGPAVSD